MASLNLSINGPAIRSSYNGVVNGAVPANSSSTGAKWALFSVQAPLANAFQESGSKESVLKVQSTGEGELTDLIEDFSEGRIQFAFVKVKDPNTSLPKHVLFAWCGEGVPERTKGYFTSHLNAVSKVLHGYHVQITARSDSDLEPAIVMQKVADASGAKYSAGDAASLGSGGAPPPIKSKPVFTPTSSSAARNPLVAARSRRDQNVDEDGWGDDAPPVTRSQLEKVDSAYKPTKVNLGNLSQQNEPSRFTPIARSEEPKRDVIGGGYQPIGKVDIAAIRAQAKEKQDDRPTIVKGAYEPVGKVDIAAIRAKAQKPTPEPEQQQQQQEEEPEQPKPLSERAAAFSQPAAPERLTSLPKPKVANKFGGASSFTGTKAPLPGSAGLTGPSAPSTAAPIAGTSRTFANEGGKTPAQIWAEKKARERGSDVGVPAPATTAASIPVQKSGEWKSGYSGKSWTVQTAGYGQQAQGEVVSEHDTGASQHAEEHEQEESQAGGVSALRDRFKNSAPISAGAPPVPKATDESSRDFEDEQAPPPPPPSGSRPSGGFALPGLPTRPPPPAEEEEEEDPSAYEPQGHEREESPIRVAQPVSRAREPSPEPEPEPVPEPEPEPEPVRAPVPPPPAPVEEAQHEQYEEEAAPGAAGGDVRAVVIYDYTKDEANEIELVEGQMVTSIEQIDPDWWMGTNHLGENGLFPSAYVEVIEDDDGGAAEEEHAAPPPPAPAERAVPAAPAAASGPTATALYDYEAAEDNELSFNEGDKITNLEFPDEDWWFGHSNGRQGLFPSNHVERD